MQYEKEELTAAVKEFISIMKQNNLGHLSIKNDKFELELGEKHPCPPPMPPMPPMQNMPPMQGMQPRYDMPAPAMPAPAAPTPAAVPAKSINSPIVGTFYAASAPDKPPFVKVGDSVNEGDVVCIIESMKVMNEIQADKSGIVTAIAVKNGDSVEYGQPLIILE